MELFDIFAGGTALLALIAAGAIFLRTDRFVKWVRPADMRDRGRSVRPAERYAAWFTALVLAGGSVLLVVIVATNI